MLSRMDRGLICCRIICTDALARGLDLPNVRAVINYDAPWTIKTYVHRVGRTARAGQAGHAYTLIADKHVGRSTYTS